MRRPLVGIKEVATRAGVSVGTVSNVLNRPDRVSVAIRDRVLGVIAEVGYVRNGSAARLRATFNNAIGLVVLDTSNPFFTEVARGVEDVTVGAGYVVMLCNSDGSAEREARHLRFLEEQRVAGLLITPATPAATAQPDAAAASLRRRGAAVVLVDEPLHHPEQCSVAVDDVLGGELAARHVIGLGRRRLVYVAGPAGVRQYEDRRLGIERAVADQPADDPVSLSVVRLPAVNAREGYRSAEHVLAEHPDSVVAGNDIVALGLMRALVERGIDIPGEVALVGYDDIDFAALATVPLTSVRQPAFQIGRTAAQLLIDECTAADHVHQQVVFQPELVVRASTTAKRPTPRRHRGP